MIIQVKYHHCVVLSAFIILLLKLLRRAFNKLYTLVHGCAKVAHCVPLGDVTSPTTVAHDVSMTCSEHTEALTAAPTSD